VVLKSHSFESRALAKEFEVIAITTIPTYVTPQDLFPKVVPLHYYAYAAERIIWRYGMKGF